MDQQLAISGGSPVRTRPWPKWPAWDENEERRLLGALGSGTWGIGGKLVPEFEEKYAALHEAKHGIACCNGTLALEIAMVAAGVRPGDEVITSPYTFMASALAALDIGAVPVLVDVQPGTHNIDPALIEDAITPRTAAIMPVHIGGRPCDMDDILEIAARRDLAVVEDACQAWTASWNGKPVGALGDAGAFSFQSSKNISAGEGGIILANDEGMFQRAWSYHNCGRTLGGAWYQHDYPGLNYRLTEFQAAVLLAQLERLPEAQARRRAAMAVLHRELAKIPGLLLPDDDPRVTAHACHIYMVRLDPREVPADKMSVVKALQAEGIPAHPGYTTPVNRQAFFEWYAERPTGGGPRWGEVWHRRYADQKLPVCEELCRTTIWVKQEILLAGPEEMGDVVEAFARVLDAARSGRLP
ncbi:MAG: DegT/DnrJ/EryC1/StrS family aminotransferase [Acidobacteria bacterium]|nr:DegT/DnrJ/EryC1/StrS family aminotransferase [Acidobacteriota bacterium]